MCKVNYTAMGNPAEISGLWSTILHLLVLIAQVYGQSSCSSKACYPQFVDLLTDSASRTVSANSTCGDPLALFDLRVRTEVGDEFTTETCDSSDPALSHPIGAIHDVDSQTIFNQVFTSPRINTWWQSENGVGNVHLTLDLGDEFLFQQTVVSFRSYRPASLIIEKSNDSGTTWSPLRYYAIDCATTFPNVPVYVSGPFSFAADCSEEYVFGHSMTEVEGQNIQQLIYNPVPELGQTYFEYEYQRYFSLTGLRLVLLDPGRQEQNLDYFAVADWLVQGQCLCYGHAAQCTGPNEAECECQHDTAGTHCDSCLPLYNNQPWQAGLGSQTNACEDCGCGGRADSCMYDEVKGYGVCENCQENTSGDKCEVCMDDFYRNPFTDPTLNETCIACNCTVDGTILNTVCNETNGQCECKTNVQGRSCDECKDTFYNLLVSNDQGCQACDCDPVGTSGNINLCDKVTGTCICKENVMGGRCDQCKPGNFNLNSANPAGCSSCDCDPGAAISGSCDPATGACTCRQNIIGRSCNDTEPGFYVPLLDGIMMEAEVATSDQPLEIEEKTDEDAPWHTGPGFLVLPPSTTVTFSGIDIPRTQNYVMVIRYESLSMWTGVSVTVTGGDGSDFDCLGLVTSGSSTTSVDLSPAGYGGAFEMSPQCLRGNAPHDVVITLGTSDGSSANEQLLLDSVVFLPVLADLEVYQSNSTSQTLRESMDICWSTAVSAIPLSTVNCSNIEFAVMAEVYNGSIACGCTSLGSDPSPVCEAYGGQCPCLQGVISRSCDFCAPFYYGIDSGTGCSACNCNVDGSINLSCNQTTGVCSCKQNVIGDKCNVCATDHFGLASGDGCVPCDCAADYSLGTSCTEEGQCDCKTGIGGLNCTVCSLGYFNLSSTGCVECGCNPIGSSDGDCDSFGQCNCLPSATGTHCDQCPQGTYSYGSYSERGCIECLCSSHTTNCAVANDWFPYAIQSHYSLLNNEGAVSERWTGITGNGAEVEIAFQPILEIQDPRFVLDFIDPSNVTDLFFVAPGPYLGDRRTAYGQMFEFTMSQMTNDNEMLSSAGDVFILGTDVSEPLVTSLPMVPFSPVTNETLYQLKLHENYWNLGSLSGPRPNMTQFVKILASISEIRVRAKYTSIPGQSVYLHDASLNLATSDVNQSLSSQPVDFVENCSCPQEYTGQFCEQCAAGYRRVAPGNGSFSACVPCECNGHSEQPCDAETGVCSECLHNTAGDFCERCRDGYYGTATTGTPDDCQPCLCPGEPGTNSFAATCDANGVCIDCAEGHGGENCEFCLEGYFGVPTDIQNNGGRCEACFCNLSPATCDSVTGQCLNCAGNTEGLTCDVCQFGFWGTIDNCQECTCNLTGGYGNCTQDAGICYCYPNVVGDQCTECAPDTWGFASGAGCVDCDCHPVGTVDQQTQCDLVNGQCACKDRVTGLKCDQCMMGYYDVDQECIACDCNVNGTDPATCSNDVCGCDLQTGQCECLLSTIAGRACDVCGRLDRGDMEVVEEIFVGDFPDCEPCPECFQNWRNELEILGESLTDERSRLLRLLSNYGNLTEEEVGGLLDAIRGNLTYANQVIQEGNQDAASLQDIQSAFDMVSAMLKNQTDLLDTVSTLESNITALLSSSQGFDGSVEVEPGVSRTSAQLDQELAAVTGTVENVFSEGQQLWATIQQTYEEILDLQIQAQGLIAEADAALVDVETAANQRATAEGILSDPVRDFEYSENTRRLQLIDSTQAAYPLEATSANLTAAEGLVEEANVVAGVALSEAVNGRVASEGAVYSSEVARFNASGAAVAAGIAFTAAANYRDVALSTKANMTQAYIDTLEALSQLIMAQQNIQEAQGAAFATLDMTVRSPSEMQFIIGRVNDTNLSDEAVQPLLTNSTASLEIATDSLALATQSLQEATAVRSQLDNIEYDLAEAERVREVTGQRVNDTRSDVMTINQLAAQIQEDAETKESEASTTLALVSELQTSASRGQECFTAKRAQSEDAGRRVNIANQDVLGTQMDLDAVMTDVDRLELEITAATEEATNNLQSVSVVDNDADFLAADIVAVENIANLNDLMAQYIAQRQEMEQLSQNLDQMEASLDAVLTNLQGDLQCNN